MKNLLLGCLCLLSFASFSQDTIFYCDFETEELAGWLQQDIDGDGKGWEIALSSDDAAAQGWGPNMTQFLVSYAYDVVEYIGLNPDNLVTTPEIEIPSGGNTSLDFKIGTNLDYMNNHNYSLYVVENFDGFDSTWTAFHTLNFAEVDSAVDVSLDLTEFAGKNVRLVFRHHDSDAQFVIILDDIIVTHEGGTSINEVNKSFDFAIYPNPAKDMVKVETDDRISQLDVLSTEGKLIKSVLNKDNISIKDLNKGSYILRAHTNSRVSNKMFIKE